MNHNAITTVRSRSDYPDHRRGGNRPELHINQSTPPIGSDQRDNPVLIRTVYHRINDSTLIPQHPPRYLILTVSPRINGRESATPSRTTLAALSSLQRRSLHRRHRVLSARALYPKLICQTQHPLTLDPVRPAYGTV